MKSIIVLFENGKIGDFTLYPISEDSKEKIKGKIFKSQEDLQNLLISLEKSKEALKRSLGCPRDMREAAETIENAPYFKYQEMVAIDDNRKVLLDKLNKSGRKIAIESLEERKISGKMKWVAEVIEIL